MLTKESGLPSSAHVLEGMQVLVVEDETLIAQEIQERLTRLGIKVVDVVNNGTDAIRSVEQHQPELILMDIRIKGEIDGIQTAEILRGKVKTPVVFLTAHSDQETLRRALGTEPFGYVLKPFQERDLIVAIQMAQSRHQLEQRLKNSEQHCSVTLASIGDGVIATDASGLITYMNPVAEALTQWQFGQARGLSVDTVLLLVNEATQARLENPIFQTMYLRRIVTLTEPTLLLARHGEAIPIDDSASLITDDKGTLLGAVVVFRDIRQRRLAEDALKIAEEQLRQTRKMEAIGRLAGGIAHDFNNLLTIINGYTEILLRDEPTSASSRIVLGEIKQAGKRAAGLTQQLLAFSRKQVLQPAMINLGNLVLDISRMLGRIIGEDLHLTINSVPDLCSIHADPSQIEQIIMNLVMNARDAMPQGGRVTIETQNVELTAATVLARPEILPGHYVILTISDTGIGMDQATQERAWEPFFTTKEVGKGTGLGLATVYGIVKQSGGFIDLYSEVGKGSTFKLYFPAFSSTTPASVPGMTECEQLCGNESILLVEDDDALRTLITSVLHSYGYTVHATTGAQEAQDQFAKFEDRIQLVITDVIMPNMNGREVVERLRVRNQNLRVLFISGYTDDAVMRHGVLAGAETFLQKPFTLEALAKKVRQVLDHPRAGIP